MAEIVITGSGYRKLPLGLLPYLSENQRNKIYIYCDRQNKIFVSGCDVIKCFTFINQSKTEHKVQCVCGVEINNLFHVQNKEMNLIGDEYKDPVIGSECINNWLEKINGYPMCKFCGRHHKDKKDCKNCKPKKEFKKESLSIYFKSWKNEITKKKKIQADCIRKWKTVLNTKRKIVRKCAKHWIMQTRLRLAEIPIFPFGKNINLRVSDVWRKKPSDVVWFYNTICMNIEPTHKYVEEVKIIKHYIRANFISKK
jgi:hypothetical protein